MMNRTRVLAIALPVALALIGALALLLVYHLPMETRGGIVTVHAGGDAKTVAANLVQKDVLPYPSAFLLFARLSGADRQLRAGRYAIPEGASLRTLIALLKSGPNVLERVLVPEGVRAEEVAGFLARGAGVDSAAFVALALDSSSASRFGVPGPTLEGYLFPDTYDIPWGLRAAQAASLMVSEYRHVMTPRWKARAESLGLTEREAVTLASIVEAETGLDEERPRVSAVFHNRLRRGWKLEADPTVRHATGNYREGIKQSELAFDSPYNTYLYPGLPPGPITNPGAAALEASLYPQQPSQELFFVATGSGGHHFSRTIDEHNRAKAKARRALSAQVEASRKPQG